VSKLALNTGDKALYTDMSNWYTKLNSLATNYSSGVATKTVPSSGTKLLASNINNLNALLTSFRSDYWLGT